MGEGGTCVFTITGALQCCWKDSQMSVGKSGEARSLPRTAAGTRSREGAAAHPWHRDGPGCPSGDPAWVSSPLGDVHPEGAVVTV